MKNYYLIIILSFTASLTSCFSAKPVIRINPEETKTTWEKGKEYVSYKKGEYETHCSFYGSNSKYIIFDIEVVNNKGVDFLVAPEDIVLYPGKWDNVKQEVIYDKIPVRAIDPEMELLKIEMANSKAEASMKNAQVAVLAICAVAVPLSIVAGVSDANNSNNYNSNVEISNSEMVDAGVNIALGATAINQISQENEVISLNDSQRSWQEASLRKTTLSPGYSIRGFVYFPIPDVNVRKILLEIPNPDNNITFKYNIVLYYPQ